jgi:hypothetical protein
MRKALLTSAIMLLGLTAVPARAMPLAPLAGEPTSVTQVAWGCGPGWTRGPYGHCHPMGYGYGAFAPVPFAPVPFYGSPYVHHCWIGRWGYRHCN